MTSKLLRAGGYAAVLLSAIGAAYAATHRSAIAATPALPAALPAAPAHVHGSAAAGEAGQPVTLSAAQARRIGVTYAKAEIGPLEKEVRTVGQVTFDETRESAIALKVDGWVERLYVDQTGQPVSAG